MKNYNFYKQLYCKNKIVFNIFQQKLARAHFEFYSFLLNMVSTSIFFSLLFFLISLVLKKTNLN